MPKREFSWNQLQRAIVECDSCPRLRVYCKKVAQEKRRAFAQETYWGQPVPGFGDPHAELWIVGLAPAAHGANRTGRMFTGDNSGLWLYRALYRAGFANQEFSRGPGDGLELKNAYISAVARCAPPQNKPDPVEIANCLPYLDAENRLLKNKKVILALGGVAWKSVQRMVREASRPQPLIPFQHGLWIELGPLVLATSFHPSQQNTFTKKLTESMLDRVFDCIRAHLETPGK